MRSQLETLEQALRWHLLRPESTHLGGSAPASGPKGHASLLAKVRAARVEVFGSDDRIDGEDSRTTDVGAWHVVACDPEGHVAGAMRLFIVDRNRESLQPEDVVQFGHVEFPSPTVCSSHVAALERLFARKRDERYYIYAGGFFTTKEWRGSGLSVALGMASIAMARLLESRFAASFVSARGRAPDLFAMLGGTPLRDESNEVVAPFHCSRHGFALQLMAFDSRNPDPKVEPGLDLMVARLRGMNAWTLEAAYA